MSFFSRLFGKKLEEKVIEEQPKRRKLKTTFDELSARAAYKLPTDEDLYKIIEEDVETITQFIRENIISKLDKTNNHNKRAIVECLDKITLLDKRPGEIIADRRELMKLIESIISRLGDPDETAQDYGEEIDVSYTNKELERIRFRNSIKPSKIIVDTTGKNVISLYSQNGQLLKRSDR